MFYFKLILGSKTHSTKMQNVVQKIFGGVFGASQILRIAERRIPFQMVYDNFEKRNIDEDGEHYECNPSYNQLNSYNQASYSQRTLSISGYDRFKLLPAAEGKNCYALETDDGKLLSFEEQQKKNILTVSERGASGLPPNFLFSLLPQPDGRVVLQSTANGSFIRV